MLSVTVIVIIVTVWLYTIVPKGFFPQQDTGQMMGSTEAAQDISFAAMTEKQTAVVDIVRSDPAVQTIGFAPTHLPLWQVSLCVQASWSSQGLASATPMPHMLEPATRRIRLLFRKGQQPRLLLRCQTEKLEWHTRRACAWRA